MRANAGKLVVLVSVVALMGLGAQPTSAAPDTHSSGPALSGVEQRGGLPVPQLAIGADGVLYDPTAPSLSPSPGVDMPTPAFNSVIGHLPTLTAIANAVVQSAQVAAYTVGGWAAAAAAKSAYDNAPAYLAAFQSADYAIFFSLGAAETPDAQFDPAPQ